MNVRTLCLAVLHFKDASGYEIRKLSVEGSFSYFGDVSFGSIYPTLAKLEDEGLVTAREETQPGKPARKIYSITDKGREVLRGDLSRPPAPDIFRSEFLLIAVCAPILPKTIVAAAIDRAIQHIEADIEQIGGHLPCDDLASDWAIRYGLACNQTALDYLRTNRDALLAIASETDARHPEAAE
ncbi:PadR family transcriptional regulator [Segnochrobactrum spirostomi]|uniref:PadR family transcriptional regulator n=1 Tax=Segnochrobactrum spirostomi TaxID=2608987 RepID=A0A6A7Y4P8_9HYPH|nr:PadR family transcriptional regulator [Segnochrobactrum spirostomi]MQT14110.1 PadR family transcriptional regulator [Segnochrobactrum spirostomi]